MNLDFVKNQRGLQFIYKGMTVEFEGRKGVITGGNSSGNINVRFEGNKHSDNCHPTYNMKYFDKEGNVIKEFKN